MFVLSDVNARLDALFDSTGEPCGKGWISKGETCHAGQNAAPKSKQRPASKAGVMRPLGRDADFKSAMQRQKQIESVVSKLEQSPAFKVEDDDIMSSSAQGKLGALTALRDAKNPRVGVVGVTDKSGNYAGFVSYKPGRGEIEIENFGTNQSEKGLGQKLFNKLLDEAAAQNAGLSAASVEESVGFYEKMGMKREGTNAMYMSADDVKQAIARRKRTDSHADADKPTQKERRKRKVGKVMSKYKRGELMIGNTDIPVKSREQAIAIALNSKLDSDLGYISVFEPPQTVRPSCSECLEKHLGAAMVLLAEAETEYPEHRLLAVGHLHEAEEESRAAWPEISLAIRQARKDLQQQNITPDFYELARLLQFEDGIEDEPVVAAIDRMDAAGVVHLDRNPYRDRIGKFASKAGAVAAPVASWGAGKVVGGALASVAASHGIDPGLAQHISESAVQALTSVGQRALGKPTTAKQFAKDFVIESAAVFAGKMPYTGFDDAIFGGDNEVADVLSLAIANRGNIGTVLNGMKSEVATVGNLLKRKGLRMDAIDWDDLSTDELDALFKLSLVGMVMKDERIDADDAFEQERDRVYTKYHDTINMSASELEKWSETDASKQASLNRSPIKRNLRLLSTPKAEWEAKDVRDANRTISFVSRMKGASQGKESDETGYSNRDVSLKNWAYDSSKSKADSLDHIYFDAAGKPCGKGWISANYNCSGEKRAYTKQNRQEDRDKAAQRIKAERRKAKGYKDEVKSIDDFVKNVEVLQDEIGSKLANLEYDYDQPDPQQKKNRFEKLQNNIRQQQQKLNEDLEAVKNLEFSEGAQTVINGITHEVIGGELIPIDGDEVFADLLKEEEADKQRKQQQQAQKQAEKRRKVAERKAKAADKKINQLDKKMAGTGRKKLSLNDELKLAEEKFKVQGDRQSALESIIQATLAAQESSQPGGTSNIVPFNGTQMRQRAELEKQLRSELQKLSDLGTQASMEELNRDYRKAQERKQKKAERQRQKDVDKLKRMWDMNMDSLIQHAAECKSRFDSRFPGRQIAIPVDAGLVDYFIALEAMADGDWIALKQYSTKRDDSIRQDSTDADYVTVDGRYVLGSMRRDGYIYLDADSKPCGEGWIAQRLTCHVGRGVQAAKQKVKDLFKSKEQRVEDRSVRKIDEIVANLKSQGVSLLDEGKGHDLVDYDPLRGVNAKGKYNTYTLRREYNAHALAEKMGVDIEEARQINTSLGRYTDKYYGDIRSYEKSPESELGNPVAFAKRREKLQRDIDNLNRYMKEMPKYEGEISRGLSFYDEDDRQAFLSSLTKSGSMSLDAMSSWSSDPDVASGFASANEDENGKSRGVILRTQNKSGVSVRDFSEVSTEDEVLTPKGTRYRVKGQSADDNGNIIIDLEEWRKDD